MYYSCRVSQVILGQRSTVLWDILFNLTFSFMKHAKKLMGVGLLTAVLVPVLTFAATATGTVTMGRSAPDFSKLPQSVQDTLKAAGVTAPTQEAIKAFETKMQNERTAMKNLSDADKASLKAIRDAARKQEREFLRSKGVDLPSEDEIAAAMKFKDALRSAMDKMTVAEMKAFKKQYKGDMGEGFGKEMKDMKQGMKGGRGEGKGGSQGMER